MGIPGIGGLNGKAAGDAIQGLEDLFKGDTKGAASEFQKAMQAEQGQGKKGHRHDHDHNKQQCDQGQQGSNPFKEIAQLGGELGGLLKSIF